MSTEENKAIVRRWFEEVINEKRLDGAADHVAQDYVDHGALPGQAPGLEGAKRKWAMYAAAFPDLRTWSEDMVAERDDVAVRWMAEGTQQGELLDMPPTGKQARFSCISIFRLAEGKIAAQWEGRVGQAGSDTPARRDALARVGDTRSPGQASATHGGATAGATAGAG